VSFRDGTFTLRDQGSVVPVFLNGQPMGNGRELPLKDGDEIRIAGYAMRAALAVVAAPVQAPAPPSLLDDTEDHMTAPVLSWTSAPPAGAAEGITTVILTTAGQPGHAAPAPAATAPAPSMPAPAPSAPAPAAPAAAPAAAPVAAPPTPATAASADADALLAGLLKGAGLRDVVVPGGLTPELMQQVGMLLHEGTRGSSTSSLRAPRPSARSAPT